MDHWFVSYSSEDGTQHASRVHDELVGGVQPIPVWFAPTRMSVGHYPAQIDGALRDAAGVLFIATPGSMDNQNCDDELKRARDYGKPIVPLVFAPALRMPLLVADSQYVDFFEDFETGIARLRNYLRRLSEPAGQLVAVRARERDARHDLARAATPQERARIDADLEQYGRQIDALEAYLADPAGSERRNTERIDKRIERVREASTRVDAVGPLRYINYPPDRRQTAFFDRTHQRRRLAEFLRNPGERFIAVMGRGGIGKTALVCDVLENAALEDAAPNRYIEAVIYLSAVAWNRITFPRIVEDISRLVPADKVDEVLLVCRDPLRSMREKTSVLLDAASGTAFVLVLDNFETLIDPKTGRIRDREVADCLFGLIEERSFACKIAMTTREVPFDLTDLFRTGYALPITLDEGLPLDEAVQMLRDLDADGQLGIADAPQQTLADLAAAVRGFPRALLALCSALGWDRSLSLGDLIDSTKKKLPESVVHELVADGFSRLDEQAQSVMKVLAVFERAVPEVAVLYVVTQFHPALDCRTMLRRLVNTHFVRKDEFHRYDLHPLDRTYIVDTVLADDDGVMPARLLRIYAADYFARTSKSPAEFADMKDLAPALAEFDLRLQADQPEAALAVLKTVHDPLCRWGYHLQAIERYRLLEGRFSDPYAEASRVGHAGMAFLRGQNRMKAIECFRRALSILASAPERSERDDEIIRWRSNMAVALRPYGRLSEVEQIFRTTLSATRSTSYQRKALTQLGLVYRLRGRHEEAITYTQEAMKLAEDGRDRHAVEVLCTTLGGHYLDLGDVARARTLFERALVLSSASRDGVDPAWRASHLHALGDAFFLVGNTPEALRRYNESLALVRTIGLSSNLSAVLADIAQCALRQGRFSDAEEFIGQSMRIAQDAEIPPEIAERLGIRAELHEARGEFEDALIVSVQALNLIADVELPLAAHKVRIAGLLLRIGRRDEARAFAHDAVVEGTIRTGIAQATLGLIEISRDARERAAAAFRDAVTAAERRLDICPDLLAERDVLVLALAGLATLDTTVTRRTALDALACARALNAETTVAARRAQWFTMLGFAP